MNGCFQVDASRNHIKTKYYFIVSLLLLAVVLYQFIPSFRLLMQGYSLDQVRLASYNILTIDGFAGTSKIGEYLNLIKSTLEIFVIAYGIERFVSDVKKNFWLMLPVLLIVVLEVFSNGGRFVIAYFALELLVCFSIYRKRGTIGVKKTSKRSKRVVLILILAAGVLTVLVTFMRGAEMGDLLKKYYRYICGNTVFLDYHVTRLGNDGIFSLSFAGLFGFWSFLLPIFHFVGFDYPKAYLECIDKVMIGQEYVEVGTNMYTNAFLSSFYHLYADFRIVGVVVGMFFFGVFCGVLYKKAINSNKPIFMVMYLIAAQMIFKTLQEYFLSSVQYFLPFVCIVMVLVVSKPKVRYADDFGMNRKGVRCENER